MGYSKIIGDKDKFIAQKENGRLDPEIRADVEIVTFSKTNPMAPRNASDYEPRTTGRKYFQFPHAWTNYSSEGYTTKDLRKIFDQSFIIASTLDSALEVTFSVAEISANPEINQVLYSIECGNIPATTGATPQTMSLLPEVTDRASSGSVLVDLPELRQPLPSFTIQVTPLTPPTTGELKIMNIRRY